MKKNIVKNQKVGRYLTNLQKSIKEADPGKKSKKWTFLTVQDSQEKDRILRLTKEKNPRKQDIKMNLKKNAKGKKENIVHLAVREIITKIVQDQIKNQVRQLSWKEAIFITQN